MPIAPDGPKTQVAVSDSVPQAEPRQTALVADNKICLITVEQMPYLPDQQVEFLHLQAEADALLLQLQAIQQKRQTRGAKSSHSEVFIG